MGASYILQWNRQCCAQAWLGIWAIQIYKGSEQVLSGPHSASTLEHYSRLQNPNISRREARREPKQGELWGSTPSRVVTHYE